MDGEQITSFLQPAATLASGVMGMFGVSSNNSAQASLQASAEAYNTEMADTAYQRGMADMKAAGLNPMLAYMQGGDSSPTAPMYQPSSPLAPLASSVASTGDEVAKMPQLVGDNSIKTSQANSAATAADLAQQTEPSIISSQQSKAYGDFFDSKKAEYDASVADASAAVAQAGKESAVTTAPIKNWLGVADQGSDVVKNIGESLGVYKFLTKVFGNSAQDAPSGKFVQGKDGTIFHTGTGRVSPSYGK